MDEAQRKLAKTFFFFALQGIRRQYTKVETVFIAHTDEAWEFDGERVLPGRRLERRHASSSSAFQLALDDAEEALRPGPLQRLLLLRVGRRELRRRPRAPRQRRWASWPRRSNYIGYVETGGVAQCRPRETEMRKLFSELEAAPACRSARASCRRQEDVWRAIRAVLQPASRDEVEHEPEPAATRRRSRSWRSASGSTTTRSTSRWRRRAS